MLKKRKLGSLGGCSLSSDAGYEFCHSFCSRRDNRVCAKGCMHLFGRWCHRVVAIVLALITKEVYSSLFVGIVIGGLFWSWIFI